MEILLFHVHWFLVLKKKFWTSLLDSIDKRLDIHSKNLINPYISKHIKTLFTCIQHFCSGNAIISKQIYKENYMCNLQVQITSKCLKWFFLWKSVKNARWIAVIAISALIVLVPAVDRYFSLFFNLKTKFHKGKERTMPVEYPAPIIFKRLV